MPLITSSSLLEQVEKEDLTWDLLTQVHVEKWPLNGSKVSVDRATITLGIGSHSSFIIHCTVPVKISHAKVNK